MISVLDYLKPAFFVVILVWAVLIKILGALSAVFTCFEGSADRALIRGKREILEASL